MQTKQLEVTPNAFRISTKPKTDIDVTYFKLKVIDNEV